MIDYCLSISCVFVDMFVYLLRVVCWLCCVYFVMFFRIGFVLVELFCICLGMFVYLCGWFVGCFGMFCIFFVSSC